MFTCRRSGATLDDAMETNDSDWACFEGNSQAGAASSSIPLKRSPDSDTKDLGGTAASGSAAGNVPTGWADFSDVPGDAVQMSDEEWASFGGAPGPGGL